MKVNKNKNTEISKNNNKKYIFAKGVSWQNYS